MSTTPNPSFKQVSISTQKKRKKIGSDDIPKGDIAKIKEGLHFLQNSVEGFTHVQLEEGKIGDIEEVAALKESVAEVCNSVENTLSYVP